MISECDRREIREKVEKFFLERKGYAPEDLEPGRVVEVAIGERSAAPVLDMVVSLRGKRFIAVKCSPGSVVSREMEALSLARLAEDYQIPFSVVTNGRDGELLDTISGRVIGENLEAIPSKTQALEQMETVQFKPLPEPKREQAIRMLLASDVVKCPAVCER